MKIQVHHEWGTLKEVVCGIPHFVIPNPIPKVFYNFVPAEGIKFFEENQGRTVAEAAPDLHKRQVAQMDAAVGILESLGVKVHRPDPIVNPKELGHLDNIFPPSVIQVFPLRRRERFGIRRLLSDRFADSDAQAVSMPPAVPREEDDAGDFGPGPFIEGGDVFVLGRDIHVGISGNASNRAGVQWLQQYLGAEYRVHEVPLTKKFLHLDCCLATPRPGLAIICREAFVDGLPAFLKDWKLIDVSFEDAHEKLATNGLVLDKKTVMIASGLDDLAHALRDAGQEVIQTPFDAIYFYGGSFRCWHHPLLRESELPT